MNEKELQSLKEVAYVVTLCASVVTFLIVALTKYYKNKRVEIGDSDAVKLLQQGHEKIIKDFDDLAKKQDREHKELSATQIREKKEIMEKILETRSDFMKLMEMAFQLISNKIKN